MKVKLDRLNELKKFGMWFDSEDYIIKVKLGFVCVYGDTGLIEYIARIAETEDILSEMSSLSDALLETREEVKELIEKLTKKGMIQDEI